MDKKPAKKKKPPVDDTTILALRAAGKSSREIGAIVGRDHTAICKRLKHLSPRGTTELFREKRADILTEIQRKILMSCTPQEIKNKPRNIRDRVTSFAVLYDKERLERNQSSMNLAVSGLSEEEIDARLAQLQAKLQEISEY